MREQLTAMMAGLKRGMNAAADLIILNILMLLCCLPVFTAGAAVVASYTCIMRLMRGGEPSFPAKAFLVEFRKAFPKATLAWLLVLLCIVLLAGDYYFAVYVNDPPNRFFLIFAITMAVVLMLGVIWLFPLMARFENTVRGHIKNALLMVVAAFPKTLSAMMVHLFFYLLPFFIPEMMLYLGWLWVLMGLTLPQYLTVSLFRQELACEPTLPEESEPGTKPKEEQSNDHNTLV